MVYKPLFRLLVVCFVGAFTPVKESWSLEEAQNVVVLANADDPDSLEIASYYVKKRGIPSANIIALPLPVEETISVSDYVNTLHNPLLNALIQQEWVRAVKAREPDFMGRERIAAGLHTISYMVTVRGVPLRIANDPEQLDSRMQNLTAQFNVNNGSVDSELALLIGPANLSMTAFVQNPLFAKSTSTAFGPERIIRVSRLDGADNRAIKRMIDRTLEAEVEGLKGRAYFDSGGPHALGDEWIRSASELAKKAFFDTDCETTKRVIDETERFDTPAIYMGWYRQNAYGPWSLPRWPVPPGAIGFHLHSFSAHTVRSTNKGWLGAFVAQGYCATVGNVYEPYLEFTHRPDILLEELLKGRAFGAAVMSSNPVLSWQGVAIGDPLYRPFKLTLAEQLQAAEGSLRDAYVYLREINRLEAMGETDQALVFAESQLKQHPSLPLVYKLAQLYSKRDNVKRAIEVLTIIHAIDTFAADEVMLVKAIADFLNEQAEYELALDLCKTLISQNNLSKRQQIVLFEDGSKFALKTGNGMLSLKWSTAAEDLKKP